MKYTITKSGNYGIIFPAPIGTLHDVLDKYLQYTRQNAQFFPNPEWARVRFLKKGGKFPWGLIYIVRAIMKKYCDAKGDTFEIVSPQMLVPELMGDISLDNNLMSNLRPYQKDAVYMLIKNRGGILQIPTAGGKTITVIEYLKLMNMKSIVIVPTLDIKTQWEEYNLPNLTVSTYQNPKLKDFGVMSSYAIVVFDETHHVASRTIFNLAMSTKTSAIIIGVSATIKREDGEDMRINAAIGKIVYSISRKELIDQGYLANARVTYLKPHFPIDGSFMEYKDVYKEAIVYNEHRNNLIIDTAILATQKKRKILILVTQIEHGIALLDLLEEYKDLKIIFMNGKSKDRDQDMSVYDIIIATSIYDEGYNLPSLDTLILAAGGKSSIKLTQRIGRVLRLKTDKRLAHVYDFIDTPKFLRAHYKKRRIILEQDFEIDEVDIGQERLGGL